MNLLDVFDPDSGITPWLVLMLVKQLPEDSATFGAFRGGPEFRAWTQAVYLQAAMTNMLYAANRQRAGKATRSPLIKPPTSKTKAPARVLDLKQVKARMKARELHERAKTLPS